MNTFKFKMTVPVSVSWEYCTYDQQRTKEWLENEIKEYIGKHLDHHVKFGKIVIDAVETQKTQ